MAQQRFAVLLLVLISIFAGCGYRVGMGQPVAGANTVALPIFDNRTWRPGVELDLARMVAAEVHARTPLRILDDGADIIVEGSILSIDESVHSLREGQRIRESSVLVTVEVTLKDGRTGENLRRPFRRTEREPFVPTIGESLRTARAEALRRLAANIVDELVE